MKSDKSYFAGAYDFGFYGNGTLTKLQIGFDCLFKGEWAGEDTKLEEGCRESLLELSKMGYNLFLCDVPEKDEILEWLDKTFDYPFTCNDYPSYYADTGDHWTTISRLIENDLCSEGNKYYSRGIHFGGNWNEVLSIIKENDIVVQTKSAYETFDDIDWNQPEEENGLVDDKGKHILGASYIPVEKFNTKTIEFLKSIAIPRSKSPVSYSFKPAEERWYIQSIYWDVKEEIAGKYGIKIEIEQGSLYYRGTWIIVKVKAPFRERNELEEICKKFCADYGIDNRPKLNLPFFGYGLSWPEGQKRREDEDDRTDFFFDSLD